MEPLARRFCLAKKRFCGVSRTFFISVFFVFPLMMRFAWLSRRDLVFLVEPWPAVFFLRGSPIVVLVGCRCFSCSFFFLRWWYFPPDGFRPCFIFVFGVEGF